MNLYYRNETLFVDVDTILDQEDISKIKRRIFKIVDDYDIDRIIFQILEGGYENRRVLQELKREYHQRYQGNLLIK